MSTAEIAEALIQVLRIASAEIGSPTNAQVVQVTSQTWSNARDAEEVLQLFGWDNASGHGPILKRTR
jgi:hypothetical protein